MSNFLFYEMGMGKIMNIRKKTVGILTGLAIIMLIAMQLIDQQQNIAWYRFLTWTTWPMIFFAAGYTIKSNQKIIQTLQQSVLKYLVPYFLISVLLIGSSKIVQMFGLTSIFIQPFPAIRVGVKAMLYGNGWPGTTMFWQFETGIGLTWVLLALFWGTVITTLIIKIRPLFLQIVLVVLITYGGFYISRMVQLPWSFTSGIVAQPFMLLGHYFNDETKVWQPARATILAGVIISWVMAHNGAYELTVALINHWIIGTIAAIIILEAMLAIIGYMSISAHLTHLTRWLIDMGKHTNISITILAFITMIVPVKNHLNNMITAKWLVFLMALVIVLLIVIVMKWTVMKIMNYWDKGRLN